MTRNLSETVKRFQGSAPFAVGDVVRHPRGYMVEITDGAYLRNGRVSNWWYWFRVDENGQRVGERSAGYGWSPSPTPADNACPAPRQEGDEYVCVKCAIRWDVHEDKPPCRR